MIFIAVSAALIAWAAWLLVRSIRERRYHGDVGWGVFYAFLVLALGGLMLVLVPLGITAQFAGTTQVNQDLPLRALAAGDSVTGQFFLGSGSVDGKRVLNYVVQRDGYATLEQVDAVRALIFEDDSAPHVERTVRVLDAWWAAPFPLPGFTYGYQFHVPAGSILENYTIQ